MSNKKSSSKMSIWRDGGSSFIKNSEVSTTATFGSAFTEEELKAADAWTAATRVDLRVDLDVALCGS